MAGRRGGPPSNESKEPFVAGEDRPEVRISLDTPLTDLSVRDLSAILGFMAGKNPNFEVGKTSLKDFFDKDFPEVEKNEKLEKNEKHEKNEKLEKREIKEVKAEKLETDGVFDPTAGPDPRIEQI